MGQSVPSLIPMQGDPRPVKNKNRKRRIRERYSSADGFWLFEVQQRVLFWWFVIGDGTFDSREDAEYYMEHGKAPEINNAESETNNETSDTDSQESIESDSSDASVDDSSDSSSHDTSGSDFDSGGDGSYDGGSW